RVLARQAHSTGHGDLASAAERETVDAGDHRFAEIFDEVENRLSSVRVFFAADCVVFRQLADIGTGDECLFARTGHDCDSHGRIILDVGERSAQLFHRGHIERVENLWTIDGDVRDGVFLFEENVFECHETVLGKSQTGRCAAEGGSVEPSARQKKPLTAGMRSRTVASNGTMVKPATSQSMLFQPSSIML